MPEVEHVRRTLEGLIVGRVVERVRIVRRDVIATARDPAGGFARNRSERSAKRGVAPSRVTGAELLVGTRIERIERIGKRMAIIGANGRALDVHLGMTGMVCVVAARGALPDHSHIVWTIAAPEMFDAPHPGEDADPPPQGGREAERIDPRSFRLVFRDPRRFGGVWTCGSIDDLRERRWGELGPDALTVTDAQLRARVAGSHRAIKAVVLDQSVVAGVGNIYADEALFEAGVHPESLADGLDGEAIDRLCAAIRGVLARAVDAGGSTIRDFAGPAGEAGSYQENHAVYGRAGERCVRCAETLRGIVVAQRTTTFCPRCQGIGPHRVPTGTGHARVRAGRPFRKSSL